MIDNKIKLLYQNRQTEFKIYTSNNLKLKHNSLNYYEYNIDVKLNSVKISYLCPYSPNLLYVNYIIDLNFKVVNTQIYRQFSKYNINDIINLDEEDIPILDYSLIEYLYIEVIVNNKDIYSTINKIAS